VQSNIATLRTEVERRYQRTITTDIPRVIVLAPDAYWSVYRSHRKTKNWETALHAIGERIQHGLGVPASFVTLHNASSSTALAVRAHG
jgi:hypothetical protein